MAYVRSTFSAGAPRLLSSQARGMGAQIFGDTRITCQKTNREGAFHISRIGFGELVLIDTHELDPDERRALRAARMVSMHDATVSVDVSKDDIASFRSPFASVRRSHIYPAYRTMRTFTIPLFELRDERWCLGALHADILPKGKTIEEAFEIYDEKFAKSQHDKLSMRQAVEARSSKS
jgi:hypothetical protein